MLRGTDKVVHGGRGGGGEGLHDLLPVELQQFPGQPTGWGSLQGASFVAGVTARGEGRGGREGVI